MANDSSPLRDEGIKQWSSGIRELLLRDDLETDIRSPHFIFQLPESVRRANPDAFLPRRIAFGPLNFNNNMQPYKVHMAKKTREELHLPQFDKLCHELRPLELRIRAFYDSHIEIGGDNFGWILLVDALFLLQLFLNISAQMENESSLMLPLPNFDDYQNLFNSNHEKLVAQFLIMSDVLKLENQIPLLIFTGILRTTHNVRLPVYLYHFCKSVSPFAFGFFRPREIINETDRNFEVPNFPKILNQSHHLLHFMYFSTLILPTYFTKPARRLRLQLSLTFPKKWMSILRSVLDGDFIQLHNEVIALIKGLTELIGMVREQTYGHKTTSSYVIPSASELQKFHVIFLPTDKGILHTEFIKGRATLTLPVITVNAFTDTLFENLVAFEAMANINPPVFARYLELMTALIPTSKDLNILKDAKIIYSHLDNDEEVVKLFKQVGSSVISTLEKPTVKNLNHLHSSNEASTWESESEAKSEIFEVINEKYEEGLKGTVKEINQYYGSFMIVKAKTFANKHMYFVLKLLAVLVMVVQIFLVVERLAKWLSAFF